MSKHKIDRNITLHHNVMTAVFTSGDGKPVSDLYLYKNYQDAIIQIERLEKMLGERDYTQHLEYELMGTGRL